MGFTASKSQLELGKKSVPLYLEPEEAPSVAEIGKALYRQENLVGSLIAQEAGLPDTKDDPDFDAYSMFTEDERLDKSFVTQAMYADTEDEVESFRRQYARERKDRDTIAKGGATSFLMALPIAVADPISLLTIGGATVNTYRAGKSILSSGLVTGSLVGAETAVQEAALHSTQLTRTYGESAMNVGASVLLGGVLGVGANKLANYGIDEKAIKDLEDVMDPEAKIARGENPALSPENVAQGYDSVGAMRTDTGTYEVKGKAARAILKIMPWDPVARTTVSDSIVTRKVSNMLAENILQVDSAPLQSAQSLAQIKIGKYYTSLNNNNNLFDQYRKGGGNLKLKEFNEAVSRAVRTGDSDIPEVKQSAEYWRKKLYDPLRDEMIGEGMLPEGVDVSTSVNYLNRVYNKDKIVANRPEFVARVSKWLEEKDQALYRDAEDAQAKLDAGDFDDVADVAEDAVGPTPVGSMVKAGDRGNTGKVIFADDNNVVVQFVNKKLGTTASKTFTPDQVTPVSKAAKKGGKKAANKEKAKLQAIIDKAEFKKGKDFEPEDYENIAAQISQRIIGTPDGRLPYDWKIGDGFSSGREGSKLEGTALRGPLRQRKFTIDDELIEDFLENDIEVLGMRYYQQTAPDIELKKKFGSVNLEAELKEIQDDFLAMEKKIDKRADLTDVQKEKERIKLGKKQAQAIEDIAGMRDRIRGVYGFQSDTIFNRIGRATRDLNYLRLMGGVTISSLPDAARVLMAEGFTKTFSKGLVPLVSNLKTFKVASAEAKRYGVGIDAMGPGGRASVIADVGDYAQGGTMVERGLRTAANKFGRINVLDYWTAGVKQLHAVVMQTSIFDGLSKGKYDKRLARLGIDKQSAMDMWKQVDKHGKKVDGVWITNAKNWDNPALEEMWGVAVRKESDRVIPVPGQEKPLFMSREMGKSIMQFRAFTMSSTQRIVVAGLQGSDHNTLGGFLAMTSMGMFTYYLKQKSAGREVTTDPAALIIEGIDRSGAMGTLMELNNTMEKISSNSFGLRPASGVSAPASRFASRTIVESMLGPTWGSGLSTFIAASNAITSKEPMTEADGRALRRLLPFQNHTVLKTVERLAE
jgi:hypothetical protein